MFRKIDDRNRFITKHSESIIKRIESDEDTSYKLFTEEELETSSLKQQERENNIGVFKKQLTHGESYRIIYTVFFYFGLASALGASAYSVFSDNESTTNSKSRPLFRFKLIKSTAYRTK